ncbi:MAG TPA: prolyl oligopeptidase family serine peptidase, partial [Gaiellaceae bacterium]
AAFARGSTKAPVPRPALRKLIGFKVYYRDLLRRHAELVRVVRLSYVANGGRRRNAYLVLPRWYGTRVHPAIPLVISPHGRGEPALGNVRLWGGLPAFGPFAVINPEGQGRRLVLDSWGWRRQIADLARLPGELEHALPWLHVDRRRLYAVGSSMGGQETLLLVALYPRMFAGAIAMDSATNMKKRYRDFRYLRDGSYLRRLARLEIGGGPVTRPHAYALRSPVEYARRLAFANVPLHIWWSTHDQIVIDQRQESGLLFRLIRQINPHAPVSEYVGTWAHSREMDPLGKLPLALVELRLITLDEPLPAIVRRASRLAASRNRR